MEPLHKRDNKTDGILRQIEAEDMSLQTQLLARVSHRSVIRNQNYIDGFSWKRIELEGDVPVHRCSHVAQLFKSTKIFVHGGCTEEEDLHDAYVLDLKTLRYIELKKLKHQIPHPLVGHSSVVVRHGLSDDQDLILLLGGWDGTSYSNRVYLIESGTFEVLQCKNDW